VPPRRHNNACSRQQKQLTEFQDLRAAAKSSNKTLVFAHVGSRRVLDTTYFGRVCNTALRYGAQSRVGAGREADGTS